LVEAETRATSTVCANEQDRRDDREKRSNVTDDREDFSRFVVHLTRDDRGSDANGGPAPANFRRILDQQQILAVRPHCLHGKSVPTDRLNDFRVACFTETPLHQIRKLTRRVAGRRIHLRPFGFVFKRQFLEEKGGQPAIYINNYHGHCKVREGFDRIFTAAKDFGFKGKGWQVLPYVNVVNDGYDFAWEREWRVVGDVDFELSDLVCAVMPSKGHDSLREKLARAGVPAVSPYWNLEKTVEQLSGQMRDVRRVERLPRLLAPIPKRRSIS
jgi:hypothetical protein